MNDKISIFHKKTIENRSEIKDIDILKTMIDIKQHRFNDPYKYGGLLSSHKKKLKKRIRHSILKFFVEHNHLQNDNITHLSMEYIESSLFGIKSNLLEYETLFNKKFIINQKGKNIRTEYKYKYQNISSNLKYQYKGIYNNLIYDLVDRFEDYKRFSSYKLLEKLKLKTVEKS